MPVSAGYRETKGIKDFIAVLMLYSHYKADDVETAVELALEKKITGSEGVRHLLIYTNEVDAAIATFFSTAHALRHRRPLIWLIL